MEQKRVSGVIISMLLALAILQIRPVLIVSAEEEIAEFDWFDSLDEVGNCFEIADSDYLNITLTSTETVHVVLESVQRTVSYVIESNNSATSTFVAIGGLESNTVYYRYQDGFLMENFTASHYGEYSYTQDISKSHRVLIQEKASTIIIDSDFTFTHNITEPIVVTASNIVIDGNGYSLIGPGENWHASEFGIYLGHRSGVTIKNLVIEDWPRWGIQLDWSEGNEIRDNVFLNNGWLSASAIVLWESNYNLLTANTFQNNFWRPGIGLSGHLVPPQPPNCAYNIISDNNLSKNSSILLTNWAFYNTVANNTLTRGGRIQVQVRSDYNLVSGNTVSNTSYGILCGPADVRENIIRDNLISGNDYGIIVAAGRQNNTVCHNNITNSEYSGIWVYYSSDTTMYGNNIINNGVGLQLSYSSGNTIYHNNIIDNVVQAVDASPVANYWHHPDLLEGNYWSDYPGIDDGSGTGKHAVAGDGIGDTAIPWPEPDFDYYPFIKRSGWMITIIAATIDIDPDTLNLKSNGEWITAYVTPPEGYLAENIDVATVKLSYNDFVSAAEWGDIQDGVLIVKFDRIALREYLGEADLDEGDKFYDVTLTVTGQLAYRTLFEGFDTIVVIKK